ncbi:MAG: imelysin family protein, partial [Marinobacter sp.]
LALVAGHIADNSTQQLQDWQAFEDAYVANEQYRDTTIKAGMAALEILEERRMAQPMGLRGTGKRSVYTADAWRSGQSLAAVEATVRGLQEHFLPGLVLLLEGSDQPELAGRIEQQFAEVLENFPAMRTPMEPLLASDEAFARLQGLYVDISQLTTLVNDQAAVALGVVRGFNSSDGD